MYKITHDLLEDIIVVLIAGTHEEKLKMAHYLQNEYTKPSEETVERPNLLTR